MPRPSAAARFSPSARTFLPIGEACTTVPITVKMHKALAMMINWVGVMNIPCHSILSAPTPVGKERTFTPKVIETIASSIDPNAIVVTKGRRGLTFAKGITKMARETLPTRAIKSAAAQTAGAKGSSCCTRRKKNA